MGNKRKIRPLLLDLGHSLDEINKGYAGKEDWRMEMGISDAYVELTKLKQAINKICKMM